MFCGRCVMAYKLDIRIQSGRQVFEDFYIRIASTKSLSFWMTTFSASLTHLRFLLLNVTWLQLQRKQTNNDIRPCWLQKRIYLHAHDLSQPPDLWHQPRLNNVTCAWSWGLPGINPSIVLYFPVTSLLLATPKLPNYLRVYIYIYIYISKLLLYL